jgi:RNA polymerase sigma-70 factor (ECF subfamily)
MGAVGVAETDEKVALFDRSRSRLFGIAYRMLGTRDDAEDILQEAYVRWHEAVMDEIETPEAWLVTVVTRLSIDRLRKASAKRETYIGPWLPEPIVTSRSPEEDAELASSLSIAFLTMLERLSPAERAVFLLHDIFDREYPEIARITNKTESAVRQMIHRARERVRTDKRRFEPKPAEHRQLIEKFTAAAYAGDEKALLGLFAPDVALTSDGGGKVTAARKVVQGVAKVVRLFTVAFPSVRERVTIEIVQINGETGVVEYYEGQPFAASTFEIEDGKITRLYRVMNPDKLRSFERSAEALSQTTPVDRLGQ